MDDGEKCEEPPWIALAKLLMTFALFKPFPDETVSQFFGGNENVYYKANELKGHPGMDFAVPWGTPIPQCCEGAYVYSLLNKDNPDLSKYRAVCTMWDDPNSDTSYEVIYGHCSDIESIPGTTPTVGTFLAMVGNTGPVYANGEEVSTAAKEAGSHQGAHLHFQVRLCKRVKLTDATKQYIVDSNGIYQKDGWYYEVVNYSNGYNGCIDPQPFFHNILAINAQKEIWLLTQLKSLYQSMVDYLQAKRKQSL